MEEKFKCLKNAELRELALSSLAGSPSFLVQFLLDATVLHRTQLLITNLGEDILFPLFHLTRTWCYVVHRERMKNLKKGK